MNFIVDANIIISALIKDSKSRELLTTSPFTFYSPDKLLDSINKYKKEFIEKSKLSTNDFEILLNFIIEKIIIVKQENYISKLDQANEIMRKIDLEDVPYIALALSIENDGIWTDDFHFQKQDKIKIYKTEDIIKVVDNIQ